MFDDAPDDSSLDMRNTRVKRAESPIPKADDAVALPGKPGKLDSPDMVTQHNRLLSFYTQELDRQHDNRIDMARDEDFYDNIQWDENDAQTLKDRGQMPLVYNVISTSLNWVIGSEKRGRTDFKVLPRRKEDGKPAERKTALMKYLSDVNRTPFHVSRAFSDSVKVGMGWLECGVQDDDDGEPVYTRYESWRNMLWDTAATEMDLSDARYVFRSKWVDADIARAMFPNRVGLIEQSVVEGDRFGLDIENGDEAMDSLEYENESTGSSVINHAYKRDRVRLIEGWFRKPVTVKRLRGGDFSGEIWDNSNPVHREQLKSGKVAVIEKVMMRVHVAVMTTKGLLWMSESPYRHNRFPFIPIWGYRRGRDGMPYGMIRGLRDIQQDINKRASKALHILSTNKVIMDKGAVDDIDEFEEEVGRPDAIIVKNQGKELTLNAERELAAPHLDLMARSIQMIQQQSGVTDELLGRHTNATSGIAIQARQDQGSLATSTFFDNLRFAKQLEGELELSLIEQYFTDEKAFRITNMRGTPEFVTINDGLPENDVIRTKADYIISEEDWRASVRQAQVAELLDMMGKLAPVAPQLVMVVLDLVVEAMDVPSREELVRRIRQVTGMRDPDATELTPEEQQQMQAQAQQQAMQQRAQMAQIAKVEADAAKSQAQAQHAQTAAQHSEAQTLLVQAQATLQNIQSQMQALQVAMGIATTPAIVPVADSVLHEAGFISRTEQESNLAQAARVQQAEQEEQQRQALIAQQQQQQAAQQGQPQQQPPGIQPQPPQ